MARFITKGVSTVRALHLKTDSTPPFPFSSPDASFWYSGQVALWQGIHRLGLKKSDRVLVPAYSCGSEIEVLLSADLILDFYRIQENLTPDLDHLEKLCQKPVKALFITHYLGFAQPIDALRRFASKHGLFLIEDNAHGLYSGDQNGEWLGSKADLSIFSLRKKLPVPDGGALIIKRTIHLPSAQWPRWETPSKYSALRSVFMMAGQEFVYRLPEKFRRTIMQKRAKWQAMEGNNIGMEDFDISQANWCASALTMAVIQRVNHTHIRETRRRNYQILDRCLIGSDPVNILFAALPEGCCPWFFPVMVDNPDGLVDFMLNHGIWAGRFWGQEHPNIPFNEFAFERLLKKKLVVLPIHQDLSEEEMRKIGDVLNMWAARNAASRFNV